MNARPASSGQSILAPDACTTRAHFAVSWRMVAASWSEATRVSAVLFMVSRAVNSHIIMGQYAPQETGWAHTPEHDDASPELKEHINEIYARVGLETRKL